MDNKKPKADQVYQYNKYTFVLTNKLLDSKRTQFCKVN